jgi:cardiolipin synthase
MQPTRLAGALTTRIHRCLFYYRRWVHQPVRAFVLCLVVTLAGCAAMPRVQPLLQAAEEHPGLPTLYGPDGPLSPRATRQVVENLEKENHDSELLRTQLTVEAALPGNPPVYLGNHAELLVDGPATFAALLKAVRAARITINMDSYVFADDQLGQRLADLLVQKQREGVQVNVIYDSVGSLDTPSAFFQRMRSAGIHVVEFNPLNPLRASRSWRINNRDHRKLLIVDGQTVFTGGVNVSDVYSSSSFAYHPRETKLPWRDTEVRITGPVAHSFQQLFLKTWRRQGGVPLEERDYFPRIDVHGTQLVRAISSDAGGEPNRVYITLISVIRNAQRSVHITAAYFAPDPQLLNSLTDAARRGVDVTMILPSETDFWPVLYTGKSYYSDLLAAGVKIYERQGVLLHAKTAVIDGVWSTIGSTNLDWRSLSENAEVDAVLIGRSFGNQMEGLFQSDLHESRRITLAQWKRRSLLERVKEGFGRILGRLM